MNLDENAVFSMSFHVIMSNMNMLSDSMDLLHDT